MNHVHLHGTRRILPDRKLFRKSPSPAPENAVSPHQGDRYRATLPIMVLAFRDNHQAATTIAAGEILEVVGPARDDRFMIINVRGNEFLIFESDLRDRGAVVPVVQTG